MTVSEFLSSLESSRRDVLESIHEIIVASDDKITSRVGKMMGREMIIYDQEGVFKYGLASSKKYMSLHLMPMYGSPKIHSKYESLLYQARFQKGCINFKNQREMPLSTVKHLVQDCARVDYATVVEHYQRRTRK